MLNEKRSGKKVKTSNSNHRNSIQNGANGAGTGTSLVSSGNFMTSSLHDDPNEDVDMAIPSPDATNNEVLDTINPDQDHITIIEPVAKANEIVDTIEPRILSKQQQQVRAVDDNYVNAASLSRFHKDIVNGGTISGGLTLDKKNKSLKNLIYYIKTAYSNNLTSPKWKNFKGLRLQVMEKIRLNNVIWRTWFEQYGIKDVSKRKRPLVCQFANTLEETTNSANLAILEGKYWKRRLESITNEYKKWRELSRKRLKPSQPINFDNLLSRPLNLNYNFTNNNVAGSNSNNSNNNIYAINVEGIQGAQYNNAVNQGSGLNVTNFGENNSGNYNNNNNNGSSNFNCYSVNNNMGAVVNEYDYNINNSGCYMNANPNNNNSNTSGNFYSNNSGFSGDANNLGGLGSSYNQNQLSSNHHFHHISNSTNKQMTFNNRCRSPSPGLFQDFDLFNFSSDTLFSTHCFGDPKESIIGTNPDLFQPDLLHLYPNFDFLELDVGFHDSPPSNNSSSLLTTPNQLKSSQDTSDSPKLGGKSINRSQTTSLFNPVNPTKSPHQLDMQQQPLHTQHHSSRRTLPNSSKHSSIHVVNTIGDATQQFLEPKHSQSFPIENYDNFNTLATVAAASPSISPSRNQQQKIYSINIDQNYDNINQVKQPTSLSPLNTKLTPDSLEIIQTPPHQSYISNNRPSNVNIINTLPTTNISPSVSSSPSNSTIRSLLSLNSLPKEFNSNINGGQSLAYVEPVMSKGLSNKEMPSMQVHSAAALLNEKLNPKLDSNNSQMSALLNAVLAPSLNTEIEISINSESKSNLLQTITPNKKRGRKSNTVKAEEAATNLYSSSANKRQDEINYAEQQIVPTKTNHSSSYSSAKGSLEKARSIESSSNKLQGMLPKNAGKNLNRKPDPQINEIDGIQLMYNSQFHQREQQEANYPSQYRNFKKQFISSNSDNNSLQSPLDSPSSNSSNFNSPNAVNQLQFHPQLNSAPSENNLTSTASSLAGTHIASNFSLNNDESNYLNKFNSTISTPIQPNIDFSSAKAHKLSTTSNNSSTEIMNFNSSLTGASSRQASRSNSVNSNNTFNDANLSSAEQKRRCNIQHGFDHLQTLVPTLGEGGKNSKASKAAMLQKTSEYIKELQLAREKRMRDLAVYKREIEQLSEKISECQNQLPANGVNVTGNLNKTEKFEQKFNAYIKEKTIENWKFYLFSLILKPLFNNFLTTLNTSSKEDMERTFYEWQHKCCNLTQLRPIASNALRHLSKSTSILSDSSKLAEECYSAALTRI